ncbi:MAG: hypothetical protein IK018_02150 [Lachnospiraceae bacterium]|nr:hypothetical protein [Lachnospiraceae bacterium]
MKYMHFNSSCSYTALAMLLEEKGIETEDTEIALEMGLPWLFAKEGDEYLAGPMLQGAKWFDLYLNPKGFCLQEEPIEKSHLPEYLKNHKPCMLGIKRIEITGKHAVVFHEYNGGYHFSNPTKEGSGQPTEIALTEEELLDSVEGTMMVGHLKEQEPQSVNLNKLREESALVIRDNISEIEAFCTITHKPKEYDEALNKLFRALLLDGITMLELAGERKLAAEFKSIQKDFLDFMRGERTSLLADAISLDKLRKLVEQYILLIKNGAV